VVNFVRRERGFSDTCRALGIEEIVVASTGSRPVAGEGRRLAELMMSNSGRLPTAVFAHNDLMALGALAAFRAAAAAVPGDFSLIGYNDLPAMDLVSPALTTIDYPSAGVGRAAGELMVELLQGGEVADVCLSPSLIVRDSTAPP
jgi:LacI family transcriptional regulator